MATDGDAEEQETQALAKIANEEYKIWKKNSPFLYDLVFTHALEWPTLTTQWFPDQEMSSDKTYTNQRILIGTHTSDNEPNYLQIVSVRLPNPNSEELGLDKFDEQSGEIGSYSDTQPRFKVIQSIPHVGEVNRARYMPQNPDLIATKTVTGDVYVFDRTKHPSDPPKDNVCRPDITLRGHSKEGFGLDWNPIKSGEVLSASEDETICHWDINSYTKGNPVIEPYRVYKGHSSIVSDVSWHSSHGNLFASVSDDKQLLIWDTRNPDTTKPSQAVPEAHNGEINAVSFSPQSEFLLVTGGADQNINLWDNRNLSNKLHCLQSHQDELISLAWSPFHPTVFCSGSSDRRVNIWDLSKIGEEQTPDDAEDGPPELLFVHGGHTARPTDVSWSPTTPWHLVSAAEDNVIQLWSPNSTITKGPNGISIPIDELE
ncbi:hypothetical protein PCANC_07746 [Puccinia coronata f. sp. avenae]|uniref:Histone-binding protein RBBP4-like N-terminal domain-containing protein n=1 Tax=Puccinia coronata f. sp. avenae TaxID=200324 RepID=A0A2N5VHE2_9BASI|nr:hypothetical protein PCASD_13401 [Puccinia coronata f. sp. avenae]PLW49392.1 hypothetical protein PCANC_07746 [Puccinia coronata f. sp. avenae]PLW51726.1 hypothetical protein PCASD_00454 [Puccinia coronata f. sp. avenae]